MAKYERANHDTDRDERVFDGGDDDDGNEGSHLAVVIIIAMLVLLAFGGVVWLAYNQGVARGRGDTPVRVAATQPAKTDGDNGIKVYQQRAGTEEDGDSHTATPPAGPAAATPAAPQTAAPQTTPPQQQVQAPPIVPPPVQPPPAAPKTVAQAPVQAAPPPVTKPAPQAMAALKPTVSVPGPTQTATKPPAALGPAHPAPVTATQPPPKPMVKAEPLKPATLKPVETAKPAASGSYYLQIGAYKSDAEARAAWKTYAAKHSTLLSGFGPDVQRAELGDKGVWYRLRVASFADKDTAAALCDRLKAQGGACYLAK